VERIEPIAAPLVAGFRAARLQEALELSELCVRSKAIWGYDETFMALARAALEVRPERIDAGDVWVATAADGSIAGIVALGPSEQPHTLDLEKLFVASSVANVSTKYRCHRLCHLQMSPRLGWGGGRARSPRRSAAPDRRPL